MFNNLEKMEKTTKNKTAMMPVYCISVKEEMPEKITVGHGYMIDRLSIWNDSSGEVYGVVYNLMGKRIGTMKLKYFASL